MNNLYGKPMTAREEEVLHKNIPDRARELVFCKEIARLLENEGYTPDILLRVGQKTTFKFQSLKWVGHPALDAGIVLCRALFQFFDVHADENGNLYNKDITQKWPDTITFKNFSPNKITCKAACSDHPTAPFDEVNAAVGATLRAANRGIAHLTIIPASEVKLPQMALVCEQAILLLNKHLYEQLSLLPLAFDAEYSVGQDIKTGVSQS